MAAVPNLSQLSQYNVTLPGWEAITQSLYDYQAYAAAGQSILNFFAIPQGQSSKTLSDTNMTLAGQLPANQMFLVQSIEVPFFPTVPAVAAQNPAAYGAGAIAQIVNDVYIVYRTGNLQFTVGSKNYCTEAPIGRFPGKTYFNVSSSNSDASTAAASQQTRIAFAQAAGRPYALMAPIKLEATQNFNVSLNWPEGVQALPSGNPGRIGVILDGVLYRKPQ